MSHFNTFIARLISSFGPTLLATDSRSSSSQYLPAFPSITTKTSYALSTLQTRINLSCIKRSAQFRHRSAVPRRIHVYVLTSRKGFEPLPCADARSIACIRLAYRYLVGCHKPSREAGQPYSLLQKELLSLGCPPDHSGLHHPASSKPGRIRSVHLPVGCIGYVY